MDFFFFLTLKSLMFLSHKATVVYKVVSFGVQDVKIF